MDQFNQAPAPTQEEFDDLSSTVSSLSDSCPTIVTNANGTAFKFPNGMMVCTKKVFATVTYNVWGDIYESSSIDYGNWAETFVETPIATYSLNNSTSAALSASGASGISATSAGTGKTYRPNNPGSTGVDVGIIAVGRWK